MGWMSNARKRMYRSVKYRLTRPSPPDAPFPLSRPVVVVGSAPVSHKPIGWGTNFITITVNGSQSVIESWGAKTPEITFMMYNQIYGTTPNAVAVRGVLTGRSTGTLYVIPWEKNDRERLEKGLCAFDYKYDRLQLVDRYERMALLDRVAGLRSWDIDVHSRCSNGMLAVLFALYNGAPAVIITGINPNSAGHSYNKAGLARQHVQMDKELIAKLLSDGRPIFTADPAVSADLGIPLWGDRN